MKTPCNSTLDAQLAGDAFTYEHRHAGAGGIAPLGAIFEEQCENGADIRIIARNRSQPNDISQPASERLYRAAMSLSAADRSALVKRLRAGLLAVRPDYRRQVSISMAEAMDLTGRANQTIRHALCSGRVKRFGIGRYFIDQASLIKAFVRKGRAGK